MDFPRNRAGSTVDNLICVSPTPGTIWALTSMPPGHRLPAAATLLPATQPNQWQPVWGSGGWAVMLPADGAAALSPLPAGPLALTPATGVAPMSEGESYVLLPGDAGFQYLPSMQARVAASQQHERTSTPGSDQGISGSRLGAPPTARPMDVQPAQLRPP